MSVVPGNIIASVPLGAPRPVEASGAEAIFARLTTLPNLSYSGEAFGGLAISEARPSLRRPGPDLLPPNATEYELALSRTLSRISDIDIDYSSLKDADRCPAKLLPLLAYDTGVDYWDNDWPEDIKRRVIKGTPEAKQLYGTDPGIEFLLSLVGIKATVFHWHQQAPEGTPGTMIVRVAYEDGIDTSETGLIAQKQKETAHALIDISKRHSLHYSIEEAVGLTVESGQAITQTSTSQFIQGGDAIFTYSMNCTSHTAAGQARRLAFIQTGNV